MDTTLSLSMNTLDLKKVNYHNNFIIIIINNLLTTDKMYSAENLARQKTGKCSPE